MTGDRHLDLVIPPQSLAQVSQVSFGSQVPSPQLGPQSPQSPAQLSQVSLSSQVPLPQLGEQSPQSAAQVSQVSPPEQLASPQVAPPLELLVPLVVPVPAVAASPPPPVADSSISSSPAPVNRLQPATQAKAASAVARSAICRWDERRDAERLGCMLDIVPARGARRTGLAARRCAFRPRRKPAAPTEPEWPCAPQAWALIVRPRCKRPSGSTSS